MNDFRLCALLATVLVTACERGKAPPRVDSAAVRNVPPAEPAATSAQTSWDPGAGPVLLVAADSSSRAMVVTPDSATAATAVAGIPHPASVTLFGRSGTVQMAELPSVTDSGVCTVATLSSAPPPRAWNVGFIGGVVAPLPVDSTQSLSHADSSLLVTWMNRLASALPNDSAGRFTGLPFVVQSMWRITIPNGPLAVVATLSRQINQEATPLVEHTLLIAEQKPNDTTFTTTYSERRYGEEETIESSDVLAAVLIGDQKNPSIILARDYGNATSYTLLERGTDGVWRTRWSSSRRQC